LLETKSHSRIPFVDENALDGRHTALLFPFFGFWLEGCIEDMEDSNRVQENRNATQYSDDQGRLIFTSRHPVPVFRCCDRQKQIHGVHENNAHFDPKLELSEIFLAATVRDYRYDDSHVMKDQ